MYLENKATAKSRFAYKFHLEVEVPSSYKNSYRFPINVCMFRYYSSKCIKKKTRKIYLMLPRFVCQFVQRENLQN